MTLLFYAIGYKLICQIRWGILWTVVPIDSAYYLHAYARIFGTVSYFRYLGKIWNPVAKKSLALVFLAANSLCKLFPQNKLALPV